MNDWNIYRLEYGGGGLIAKQITQVKAKNDTHAVQLPKVQARQLGQRISMPSPSANGACMAREGCVDLRPEHYTDQIGLGSVRNDWYNFCPAIFMVRATAEKEVTHG